MDPNNINHSVQEFANSANSLSDAVRNVTTTSQYLIGWIVGLIGMVAHHVFLVTLIVRFVVVGIVMGILWHVGWTEYNSFWDFAVASILLVGLGAICANLGKVMAALPLIILPALLLVDAGCFAFADWFIPGMSSVRPIAAPLIYSAILLIVQLPFNFTPT